MISVRELIASHAFTGVDGFAVNDRVMRYGAGCACGEDFGQLDQDELEADRELRDRWAEHMIATFLGELGTVLEHAKIRVPAGASSFAPSSEEAKQDARPRIVPPPLPTPATREERAALVTKLRAEGVTELEIEHLVGPIGRSTEHRIAQRGGPIAPAPRGSGRVYRERICQTCREPYAPRGPRGDRCDRCRKEAAA